MKKIVKIIIYSIVILIITSILSYNDNRNVDGLMGIGFPFSNYESCGDCVEGFKEGYLWGNVLKNLIFYVLIVSLVFMLIQKFKK
ncbi:hypothetical protein [Flavobacterium sp.]|uniref:hypothetical protein n=1 Tax=Flavobacterium sp. TaxID=239 RepID=UPI00286D723C|nr:hypothetical protein [Flavobacterium sp.]